MPERSRLVTLRIGPRAARQLRDLCRRAGLRAVPVLRQALTCFDRLLPATGASRVLPLPVRLRPQSLADIVGQDHLLGPDGVLRRMAQQRVFQSTILWGPPGVGKTTLVRALAAESQALFQPLNATDASVKEVRQILAQAVAAMPQRTFVFVDEIHRWSKSQQDVLLPAVEDGTVILFGATTEKPKFAVNSTLLSRCLVLEVRSLGPAALLQLLGRAKAFYKDQQRAVRITPEASRRLIARCGGDARKLLLTLETVVEVLAPDGRVTVELVDQALPDRHLVFDARGNEHYDLAHAFQEALQHSDVDGALYWLGRWLASGEDPAYISRRLLIAAFEDAAGTPQAALVAAAAAWATERTGMPECMIPLALATAQVALSPRDKSAHDAIKAVMADLEQNVAVEVPPELRAGTSGYVRAVTKRYWSGPRREPPGAASGRLYAIGQKIPGEKELGMCYGPTPVLEELLAVDPGPGEFWLLELPPQGRGVGSDEDFVRFRWRDQRWEPHV